MNVTHRIRNAFGTTLLLSLSLLTLPLRARAAADASPTPAQDRGPVQRIVHGRVEDKGGTPLKGAVVYLQDGRNASIRSAITGDDGTYRFVQLSQGIDYQLWAKLEARKSKNKSISSFDNKNDITLDLKIED